MSADYLDLLLGRATGSVPAAEPRIHSAMAPAPAAPVWGEVVEESMAPYPGPAQTQYRGATPSPQHAAQASMPPGQWQAPPAQPPGPGQWQDTIAPGRRIANPADGIPDPPERSSVRAPVHLLRPAAGSLVDEGEPHTPHTNQTTTRPPSATAISHAEEAQPESRQQPRLEQARQPVTTSDRSLLPRHEFAPALTQSEHKPQRAPEPPAATVSAPAPVTIRIDRIEVHTAPPAKAAAPPSVANPPAVRLDDYLSRRKGSSR